MPVPSAVMDGVEGEPVFCFIDQGQCILPAFRKLLKLELFVIGGLGVTSALGGDRIHLLASGKKMNPFILTLISLIFIESLLYTRHHAGG